MSEFSDLPPDERIRRYLDLAAEARKDAPPYSRLFIPMPPDPRTTMLKELAKIYAIVGVLLFLVALISATQAVLGSLSGPALRTA